MFKRQAKIHKRQFEKLVDSLGVIVTVRQPQKRNPSGGPGNMAERVFGRPEWESEAGETQDIKVLWSNDYLRPESAVAGDISAPIASLAQNTQKMDAVLRLRLADALIDPGKPQGRTIFETAKDVVYQGQIFEVLGVRKTGLPPEGPYILWVGLRLADKE